MAPSSWTQGSVGKCLAGAFLDQILEALHQGLEALVVNFGVLDVLLAGEKLGFQSLR